MSNLNIEETLRAVTDKVPHPSDTAVSDYEWMRQQRAGELLAGADCPARHLTCKPKLDAPGWGERYESLLAKLGTGFLIALIGPRGPGKTQMGVELIRQSTNKERRAKYVKALRFFMAIRETYRRDSEKSEVEVVNAFIRPKLLVIDECHERGEKPWEDRMLTLLLDQRYDAKRDTIIISNQTQQEFDASFGPSLLSRMNETGGVILCDWESFRGK